MVQLAWGTDLGEASPKVLQYSVQVQVQVNEGTYVQATVRRGATWGQPGC